MRPSRSRRSASRRACATPRSWPPLIRAYRGEVSYADAQVGRLVEGLRSLGLLDETAVVVSSDHGEGLGDHGLLEHGANLHDELVRVPLVLRAPGLPRGRRLAGSAQLEDLAPTLLSLAGVPVPPGLDGMDLGPWLAGRAAALASRRGPGPAQALPGPARSLLPARLAPQVDRGQGRTRAGVPARRGSSRAGRGRSASGCPRRFAARSTRRCGARRAAASRREARRPWRLSATSTERSEGSPHSA